MDQSIQIIHDEFQGGEYRLLADFFRMVGFFVVNQTVRRSTASLTLSLRHKHDCTIILDSEDWENDDYLRRLFANVVILRPVPEESYSERWKKRYLLDCLDVLSREAESIIHDDEEYAILQRAAIVYADCDLLRYRLAINSFFFRTEIMKESVGAFDEALTRFNDHSGESYFRPDMLSERAHFRHEYFRLTLMRFINESCNLSKKRLVFDTEDCVDFLNDKFQGYKSGAIFLLQGLICSADPEQRFYSGEYYDKAVQIMEDSPQAGFCNYQLGRYMEKVMQSWRYAEEYYRRAYELRPTDIKAIYKMAILSKLKRDSYQAIGYFNEILSLLKGKEERNYLEPKEYEYLFKAYHGLYLIYNDQPGQREQAERMRRKRELIIRQSASPEPVNSLYLQLFGAKAWTDGQGRSIKTKDLMQDRILHTACN